MSYRWELLLWLWLAFFFHQADRQIFNVVLPLVKTDLGLTDVQIGWVGSVFVAATAVMVPLAGLAGDAFSRRRIASGSLFAWSLATLCTGFGGGLAWLIAVRSVATAVGEAFYFPSAAAMLSAEHVETRARAMSLLQTSVYVGLVASGWIGGALADRLGWRAAFWIFGAAGVVLAAVVWRRLRETPPAGSLRPAAIRESVREIVATRAARFAAAASGAMVFVNVGYLAWMPIFLYERFHLSLAEAGLRSMLFHHVFAFAGVMAGGTLSDRWAPRRPQVRFEIQAAALLAGAPFLYAIGKASTEWAAYAALAGFGFFRGLFDSNTYPAFYSVIAPRFHSTASGLLIAFSFLVASAAPVLLGKAKETVGLAAGLSSLAAVYAAGSLMSWRAAKTR